MSETPVVLRLYITGRTARSRRALTALQRICDEHLSGQYELTVIDVLERPHLAEEARILATPTLVRVAPLPERRILGDLTHTDRVLAGLELERPARPKTGESEE